MAMPKKAFLFTIVAIAIQFIGAPALANFSVCNKTNESIETALGYQENLKWYAEGWWIVHPGKCHTVFQKPLTAKHYYFYAHNLPAKNRTWRGKYAFCVDNRSFKAEGDGHCEARRLKTLGFVEVDVGGQRQYELVVEAQVTK
jgi:uncharacterized membrane protein